MAFSYLESKCPTAKRGVVILIDPPSAHYFNNLFFELSSPLNRDNTLRVNFELKVSLEEAGYPVFTADFYQQIADQYPGSEFHYWSFGAPAERALNFSGNNVKKKGAVLFEPPLVKPNDYKKIEFLLSEFDHVFLHNVIGDGYHLPPPRFAKKMVKFYWTNKNFQGAEADNHLNDRRARIALIAGAHFAKALPENGYGKRLDAIRNFGFNGDLDLFGFGWGKLQFRSPLSSILWLLRMRLANKSIQNPVRKYDVYQRYDFALCFENMAMCGYITEKIFDALFAKSIPIYWGAPDISDYIPSDCFVALNDFEDMEACFDYCFNLTDREKAIYRASIERFLSSDKFARFSSGIHGDIFDLYTVRK